MNGSRIHRPVARADRADEAPGAIQAGSASRAAEVARPQVVQPPAPSLLTRDALIASLQPHLPCLDCPICTNLYTAEHMPTKLAYGHIIGDHCIVKWLKSSSHNANSCPFCHEKLFENDTLVGELGMCWSLSFSIFSRFPAQMMKN